jgi:hypothetical protein
VKSHVNLDHTSDEIDYPYFAKSLLHAHKFKPLKQIMGIASFMCKDRCDMDKLRMEMLKAMETETFLSKEEFEQHKKEIT